MDFDASKGPESINNYQKPQNLELYRLVDELIERVQIEELSLNDTLDFILPEIAKEIDCDAIFLRTFNEDLNFEIFKFPSEYEIPVDYDVLTEFSENKKLYIENKQDTTISLRVDVAGTYFGFFGAYYHRKLNTREIGENTIRLNIIIEIIDNYLSMIYNSVKKQKTLSEIGDALSDKILLRGLDSAVLKFYSSVAFDKLLFLYWNENKPENMRYVYYDKTVRTTDSESLLKISLDKAIKEIPIRDIIEEKSRLHEKTLQKLQFFHYIEKALIYGKSSEQLVGKLIISRKNRKFNTVQKDLLSNFSALLRQRIVDFNKEYNNLSSSFSASIINDLLSKDDYSSIYLNPKEKNVAVLFSDICCFTKICEQVLVKPTAIAAFINEWAYLCVDIIWKNNGVFDKMVGDCIIAIFGPPFYSRSNEEVCVNAINTAVEINKATYELAKLNKYAAISASKVIPGLGTSSGINFCPMFIGSFGPNNDFTGFSKGMNITSRLQSIAGFREILVSQSVKDILKENLTEIKFGPLREAKLKNIEDAVNFYSIIYQL